MPSKLIAPTLRQFVEQVLDVISGDWTEDEIGPTQYRTGIAPRSSRQTIIQSVAGQWGSVEAGAVDPGPDPGGEASFADQIAWLRRHSIKNRLDFRTHTGLPRHAARRPCGCTVIRDRLFAFAQRDLGIFGVAVMVAVGNKNWYLSPANAQALGALSNHLNETRSFKRPMEMDLTKLRQLLGNALASLDENRIPSALRDNLAELARNLEDLEEILNDYSGADLSGFDLREFRLAGIRWSEETKWPWGWRRRIMRDSVEITTGTFVIQGDDPLMQGPSDG